MGLSGEDQPAKGNMTKKSEATCSDCYFQRAGLCALALERPCPTFRADSRGSLVPPRQARLVPLPTRVFTGRVATA